MGRVFGGGSDASEAEQVARDACARWTHLRKECWASSLRGKEGEECLGEELQEKRCYARFLCPREARRFYGDVDGRKKMRGLTLGTGVCSLWAESFAFLPELEGARASAGLGGGEDGGDYSEDLHRAAREKILQDRKKKKLCTKRAYELSHCFSRARSIG